MNEEACAGASVQWEWCGDSLEWIPYLPSSSAIIENAFQSGKTSVNLAVGRSSYTIKFTPSAAHQRNLSTFRTRPVHRRTVGNGDTAHWFWWEEERQCWHLYEAELAAQIEKAWTESNSSSSRTKGKIPAGLLFSINGQKYEIKFEVDAIQYNVRTQFSRGIRRNVCVQMQSTGLPSANETTVDNQVDNGEEIRAGSFDSGQTGSSSSSLHNQPNGTCYNTGHLDSQQEKNEREEPLCYNSADIVDYESASATENCSICLSSLSEKRAALLMRCKHFYHRECIERWFEGRPTCPECLTVYGTIVGTQPPGEMQVEYITYGGKAAKYGLEGYPNTDIIKISYRIPNGIQGEEHPNPGNPYSGTRRFAYLPKNKDGEEVLELLKKAWERRLLFRVGVSVTTGQDNVVTWAGVHHKTSMSGGSSNHGYPDETYFSRVKKELEDLGVT